MSLTVRDILGECSGVSMNVSCSPENQIYDADVWDGKKTLVPGVFYVVRPGIARPDRPDISVAAAAADRLNSVVSSVRALLLQDYRRAQSLLRLHEAVLRGSSADELAALCRMVLGNPVWIANARMEALAFSVGEKRLPVPFVPKDTVVHVKDSVEAQEPDNWCPCRRLVGKITGNKKVLGFIVALEIENIFGNVREFEYAADVCRMLSEWEPFTNPVRKGPAAEDFMIDLLERRITDRTLIEQNMLNFGMPRYDRYYVLTVNRTPQEQSRPLQNEIERFLGKKVFLYGRYYFALVGCAQNKSLNYGDFEKLTAYLKSRNIAVGLSNAFSDPAGIPLAFEQGIQCFKCKSLFSSLNFAFVKYEDRFFSHLLKIAEDQKIPLLSVCHPVIVELLAYDRENGTDYFKTLTVYLFNKMNLKTTSEMIFTHRNTVYKRLQWIEENYPLDFENSWTVMKLQMSILIVGYLGLVELTPLVDPAMLDAKFCIPQN